MVVPDLSSWSSWTYNSGTEIRPVNTILPNQMECRHGMCYPGIAGIAFRHARKPIREILLISCTLYFFLSPCPNEHSNATTMARQGFVN